MLCQPWLLSTSLSSHCVGNGQTVGEGVSLRCVLSEGACAMLSYALALAWAILALLPCPGMSHLTESLLLGPCGPHRLLSVPHQKYLPCWILRPSQQEMRLLTSTPSAVLGQSPARTMQSHVKTDHPLTCHHAHPSKYHQTKLPSFLPSCHCWWSFLLPWNSRWEDRLRQNGSNAWCQWHRS